jgi:hypothetical protein
MLRSTNSLESMRLGLGGDALGASAGSDTKEVPVGSGPRAAWARDVRELPAPGEPHAPFGLEGFREFGVVPSA